MEYTYLVSIKDEFFIIKTNANKEEFAALTEECNTTDSYHLDNVTLYDLAKEKGFEITIGTGDGYFHINGDGA